MNRALSLGLQLVCLAAVLAKILYDLASATTDGLQPNLAGDAFNQVLPFYEYAKSSVGAGILPLWNPYSSIGTPFLGDMSWSLMYPFTWVILLTNVPLALLLLQFLTLAIGIAGTYCYTRYLELATPACLVAAALFAYALFTESLFPTLGSTLCWFPAILWRCHLLIDKANLRNACLLALVMGLCFLGGFPNFFIYTCLILAVYFGVFILSRVSQLRTRGVLILGGFFGVAAVLTVALIAMQLLPLFELSTLSVRDVAGKSAYNPDSSWENFSLALLYQNFLNTENGFVYGNPMLKVPSGIYYMGSMLAFVPFAFTRGATRIIAICLTLSLLLISAFIVSYQVPALAFLQHLPLADSLRVNSRAAVYIQTLLILISSIGLSNLLGIAGAWSKQPSVALRAGPAIVLLGYIGCLCYFSYTIENKIWTIVALGVVVAVIGLSAIAREKRWTNYLGWCLAIVVIFEVSIHRENRFLIPAFGEAQGKLVQDSIAHFRQQDSYQRLIVRGRSPLESYRWVNVGAQEQIPVVDGYIQLTLARWHNYLRYMIGPKVFDKTISGTVLQRFYGDISSSILHLCLREPEILQMASMRYLYSPKGVTEFDQALPRAYVVSHYTLSDNEEESLAGVRLLMDAPADSVVLEGGAPGFTPEPNATSQGSVIIDKLGPNEVVLSATTEQAAIVVLNDAHYPGWIATVDGEATTILRANSLFRAVEIGPGSHTIRFSYQPASVYWGAAVSFSALVLILGLLVMRREKE